MVDQISNKSGDEDSSVVSGDFMTESSAAELIRQKVARLYGEEPDVVEEITETGNIDKRSKHQQFMFELSKSGKDLATIQTEWHSYYTGLSNEEKHKVWQEFYESQPVISSQVSKPKKKSPSQTLSAHKQQAAKSIRKKLPAIPENRSTSEIRESIRNKVTAGGQLKAKHHIQSLLFGLSMGLITVFIFLFGFFNQVIIAPFIQPSRVSASTPIILSNSGVAPTPNPEVIIPKINVQIPVNYNETSTDENIIENDLQGGIVHYPTTVLPGQTGNAAFYGHSSNNIFNPGKYKFAFVLLHTIVPGDTFYLTNNNKVYVYKVISRNIVDPSDVGVLNAVPGQTATATLITCDPPGTSLKRLIVVGQQISPDPSGNSAPTSNISSTSAASKSLPSDAQSLWSRIIKSPAGKIIIVFIIGGAIIFITRKLSKEYTR